MASTRVYDPDQIVAQLGGADISEFQQGNFLSVTYLNAQFVEVVGATGHVARSKSNDLRATVTFRLMTTSPSNDILSALWNADLLAPNGAGIVTLYIADAGTGRALFTASEAWIEKGPDWNYDQTAVGVEWTIRAAKLVSGYGGA